MITCPQCNYQNPDGSLQCESCFAPLGTTQTCPNCGAIAQLDANFCGQCGFPLRDRPGADPESLPNPAYFSTPHTLSPGHLSSKQNWETALEAQPIDLENRIVTRPAPVSSAVMSDLSVAPMPNPELAIADPAASAPPQANLLHLQTNVSIPLPEGLEVIHLGKPNDSRPPDLDLSGLPDSDIISRVHAAIVLENQQYFLEDSGSSNGTYLNNMPLRPGKRRRLQGGDRISLGKGDLVSFLFRLG